MNIPRRTSLPALLALLISAATAVSAASGVSTPAAPPAGAPARLAVSHEGAGFIYGHVMMRDGTTHEGYLRWKDEDAFWDDLFSARQNDPPWFEYADQEQLAADQRQRYYQSHGLVDRLAWAMHHRDDEVKISRRFICRYGDLAALKLTEDEEEPVVAVVRDGREVTVRGPSRDVDSDLLVYGKADKPAELAWADVREIRFAAAPATATPYARRLAGTVEARGGTLVGNLQWDTSECTSLDVLDSKQEDVPLEKVRRIARNRRGGSSVTLLDGRALELEGTNDVGEGNRGVAVEVAGLGRVLVPWNRFTAADLRLVPAVSPSYADFAVPTPLKGTIATNDGKTLVGRLVYDLDEAYTCDLLHGKLEECDYQIPFARVAAIAPRGEATCEVTLRDGRKLVLGGDEDTGEGHAGMLVFADGQDKPTWLPWSAVKRIDFTP
jgi:hypothetical protein